MNIKYFPQPDTHSFRLFAEPDYKKLLAQKWVNCRVTFETKTRVMLNFYYSDISFTCNKIVPGSEKFKFAEKTETNFLSGSRNVYEFFVLSKKQGLKELEEHIINTWCFLMKLTKEDDFLIHVEETDVIEKLKLQVA